MLTRYFVSCALVVGFSAVASAGNRPVVVELFTSEGCSSCPPADAYLTELAHERRDVLALAFHVTYWNSLGWRDPYSLQIATQRQATYGALFGDGSYTPEMVIDGKRGVVGSNREDAERAIEAAKSDSTFAGVEARREGNTISINLGSGSGSASVILVGLDAQRRTSVGRGENSGRTLTESNIVRSFTRIGTWDGSTETLRVPAPRGDRGAVILQSADGSIVGGAFVSEMH
jgi:hypothetical protein